MFPVSNSKVSLLIYADSLKHGSCGDGVSRLLAFPRWSCKRRRGDYKNRSTSCFTLQATINTHGQSQHHYSSSSIVCQQGAVKQWDTNLTDPGKLLLSCMHPIMRSLAFLAASVRKRPGSSVAPPGPGCRSPLSVDHCRSGGAGRSRTDAGPLDEPRSRGRPSGAPKGK